MLMKNFVCVLIQVFASVACAQNAMLIFTGADGKVSERIISLENIENSQAKRLRIKKGDIPPNTGTLDVKFDFAKAKKGEKGYFVFSDGRLGSFKLDNAIMQERRNPMPIFGMKIGDTAFVAIVKGLKYEFSTIAEARGGLYGLYPRFHIGELGGPVYEDIVIDVTFFEGREANYSSMAREYRRYQLGRGEVKSLRDRAKGRPELAYAAESMYLRFLMAQKPNKEKIGEQNLKNEPPLKIFMDFKKTGEILRKLGNMGIKELSVCYVGWNSGGLDGRFPTLFPPDERLGGKEEMLKSLKIAHDFGYQTVAHVCNTDFYSISERFDVADLSWTSKGKPAKSRHIMSGGIAYKPCFERVYKKYVSEDLDGLANLGIRGLHHIDVTSCITPWACHNPKHPCTRADTAYWMNKIGLLSREKIGGFASEGPCDHVANSLDYALYVSAYPRYLGRENKMMDKMVPLWQIAYHGIILSNPFYSTIDPFYENSARSRKSKGHLADVRARWLKIVEFGGRPAFYGTDIYKDLAPVKRAYCEWQKIKHLQWEFMDYHDEISPGVFLTKYGDGTKVLSNYTDKIFSYEGVEAKPMDYALISTEGR